MSDLVPLAKGTKSDKEYFRIEVSYEYSKKPIEYRLLLGVYECSAVNVGSEVKKVQCEEISSVQWQSASEAK